MSLWSLIIRLKNTVLKIENFASPYSLSKIESDFGLFCYLKFTFSVFIIEFLNIYPEFNKFCRVGC